MTSKSDAEKALNDLEDRIDKMNMEGKSCAHIGISEIVAIYRDDENKLKQLKRSISPVPF